MKKLLFFFVLQWVATFCFADTGSFIVRGDADKFYPVTFLDYAWDNNLASEISIGRTSVHLDASWKGSMLSHFKYHVTNWGHQSHFIDADIKEYPNPMIAGWHDMTSSNGSKRIIIWLKGGNTTYYYNSPGMVSPQVYDNAVEANHYSLPLSEVGGPTHGYKTAVEGYVNASGMNLARNLSVSGRLGLGTANPMEKFQIGDRFAFQDGGYKGIVYNMTWSSTLNTNVRMVAAPFAAMYFTGEGNTLFVNGPNGAAGAVTDGGNNSLIMYNSGQVGVGTSSATTGFSDQSFKLFIEGGVRARKVKVDINSWADYVFEPTYQLPSLQDVEHYIIKHKHLPGVPSANEIIKDGLDVGENQAILLKKIEELTLYILQQQKELEQIKAVNNQLAELQKEVELLKSIKAKK